MKRTRENADSIPLRGGFFRKKVQTMPFPTFPGSFSGVRYGQIRFISFFRKKRKSKTSVGSIFRCAPRPPDFSDGKRRRLQNRFPFRRKREKGQGQERGERLLFRARVQPPRNLRVHRPIQSLLMRLFQTRRVFIEYRHFVLPPGLFAPAFEAVFPSAFPFALFYDDSIAYIT